MESTTVQVSRVAPGVHWHALEDDEVVGRAYALHRPDGRVLVSVDSWRDDVFHLLAAAMADDLGGPLYTVVDDDDREVLGRWASQGYVDHRRESEFAIPLDPAVIMHVSPGKAPDPGAFISTDFVGTDLVSADLVSAYLASADLASADLVSADFLSADFGSANFVSADRVDEGRLRDLDQRLRQEVPGSAGWINDPERFREMSFHPKLFDPATFLVAEHEAEYIGLVRISRAGRRPRLTLIGVLPQFRRQGLATALLAAALKPLHERGVEHVSAIVDETAHAARALVEGFGAKRVGGAVELIKR